MKYGYVSFSDGKFQGGAYLRGKDLLDLMSITALLQREHGNECWGIQLNVHTHDRNPAPEIPEDVWNKFLPLEDLVRYDTMVSTNGDVAEQVTE